MQSDANADAMLYGASGPGDIFSLASSLHAAKFAQDFEEMRGVFSYLTTTMLWR